MAYIRKTQDIWYVYGNFGQGWEQLCGSTIRKEALEDLKAYRENSPGNYKLKKHREKI